jgi:periplasmic divalent cation tolerance protein
MSTAVHLVLVTCPPEAAPALAETLVRERVAACVNLLPQIRSVYRWQGEVRNDDEALLIIKAPAADFDRLKQTILAHHPYELPEILAVNPAQGHAPYLDWVLTACL